MSVEHLLLVCTDRGEHPRRKLGWLTVRGDRVLFEPWAPRPAGHDLDPVIGRVAVRCRTCERDVQMTTSTARRLADGLGEADEVDISALPF